MQLYYLHTYRLEDSGILDHDVSMTGQSCLFLLWSVFTNTLSLMQALEKVSYYKF